jgi:hypothetical protein
MSQQRKRNRSTPLPPSEELTPRGKFWATFVRHVPTAVLGIVLGLLGNLAWDEFGRPRLTFQYSIAGVTWQDWTHADSVVMKTAVVDVPSGDTIVWQRTVADTSQATVGSPSVGLYLKLLIRNSGRKAATNARIPIYIPASGTIDVSATPNAQVDVESDSTALGATRLDVVTIKSIPPRSIVVVTYEFVADSMFMSRTAREIGYAGRVVLKSTIPTVVSDETGAVPIPRKRVPFGYAFYTESRLRPNGVDVGYVRMNSTGRGVDNLIPSTMQIVDPWLLKGDSMARVTQISF